MKTASSNNSRNNQYKKGDSQKSNVFHDKNKPMKKKELKDYTHFLGTAKQVSEYELTTLFIINHREGMTCMMNVNCLKTNVG
jgi:hypothetical protein